MRGIKRWRPTPGEQYLRDRGDLRDGEKHKGFVQERVLEDESARFWVRDTALAWVHAASVDIVDLILRESDAQLDDAGLTPLQIAILSERARGASVREIASERRVSNQAVQKAERYGRKKLGGLRLDISETYRDLVRRPLYRRHCGRVRLAA